MFQVAQEHIGGIEVRDDLCAELPVRGEHLQHAPGRQYAQPGILPAAYQLEHLRDEFDLADAAGAELDVVEQVAALHFLADLRVQPAHRLDRAEVQVFAEHERLHQLLPVR